MSEQVQLNTTGQGADKGSQAGNKAQTRRIRPIVPAVFRATRF